MSVLLICEAIRGMWRESRFPLAILFMRLKLKDIPINKYMIPLCNKES